jgi:hypothetical protein
VSSTFFTNLFSNINTIKYLKLASSQSPNADDTSGHIAIWGFGKVVITVPLSENWAALLHCGYQFDLNKFEVTDLGGFGPLKIEGVSHFNFGCVEERFCFFGPVRFLFFAFLEN